MSPIRAASLFLTLAAFHLAGPAAAQEAEPQGETGPVPEAPPAEQAPEQVVVAPPPPGAEAEAGETRPRQGPGQLTLEEAQRIALERSPSVQAIAQELDRADAQIREAWASIFPQINADIQYVMADQPTVVNFGSTTGLSSAFASTSQSITIQPQHVATLGVTVVQPVFNAQAYPAIQLAYQARDLTGLTVEQARVQLAFGVAQTFYAVISSARTMDLLERSIALAEQDVVAARARLEAQVGLAFDVSRAELEVEQLRGQLAQSRLGYDNTRDSLALLMGIPLSELPELAEPAPVEVNEGESPDDFIERAMNERLDLQASEYQVRMAELGVTSAWASFSPSLNLSWALNNTLTELGGFGARRTTWNLVAVLSVPIFDGGFRYGLLRDRRALVREAELNQESITESISSQVRQAYRTWQTSLETLEISRRSAELARETYRLVHASFAAGAASSLDVVDAQRALIGADVNVELQRLNAQLALVTLFSRLQVGPPGGLPASQGGTTGTAGTTGTVGAGTPTGVGSLVGAGTGTPTGTGASTGAGGTSMGGSSTGGSSTGGM